MTPSLEIKRRSSNIELLRIIVMLFVLIQHANFLSVGIPNNLDCISAPGNAFVRFFIQSIAIVAVNVFVIISGWFGIKPTIEKLCSLLFQVFFFTLLIPFFFVLIKGWGVLSPGSILKSLLITKCYWFVKSYICLFILSPVLNSFVENSSKKTIQYVLIGFFTAMVIYGWTDSAPEFSFGYSTLSFVGIYLLARYFRLYQPIFTTKLRFNLICYIFLAFILTCVVFFLVKMNYFPKYAVIISYSYINPIILAASFALFFVFKNIHLDSKIINWISASAFSVYIIHINGFIFHYFRDAVWSLYSNHSSVASFFLITLFLVLVFVGCVLLDRIRILAWSYVSSLRCK